MGFLKNLLGSGIKETADAAGGLATDIRNAVTGEATELKAIELEAKLRELQTKINEAEAQSGRFFVAGARPFILWVCGVALAYQFLIAPILAQLAKLPMPELDMGPLMTLLFGMLGLSSLRTYEKFKGVQDKH